MEIFEYIICSFFFFLVPEKLSASYSISSLEDMRFMPKAGDLVECRLVFEKVNGKRLPLRADKILPISELKEAAVASIIKNEVCNFDNVTLHTV